MRIISGEARGRKLVAPAGEETRPTSDKVRGSLFNIIGARVYDAQVLDLFGGTGAMALEALSRGAEHAVIVDSAREAIQAIERNAEAVLAAWLDTLGEEPNDVYREVTTFAEEFADRIYFGTDICAPDQIHFDAFKLSSHLDNLMLEGKISYDTYERVSRKNLLELVGE